MSEDTSNNALGLDFAVNADSNSPQGPFPDIKKEKEKPYINPERVKTGGPQRDKLSEEALQERMIRIREQNEKIKQRRLDVQADEEAFRTMQETERAKQAVNRKIQADIDRARDHNAKRKMDKVQNREWDSGKASGPGERERRGPPHRKSDNHNRSQSNQPTVNSTKPTPSKPPSTKPIVNATSDSEPPTDEPPIDELSFNEPIPDLGPPQIPAFADVFSLPTQEHNDSAWSSVPIDAFSPAAQGKEDYSEWFTGDTTTQDYSDWSTPDQSASQSGTQTGGYRSRGNDRGVRGRGKGRGRGRGDAPRGRGTTGRGTGKEAQRPS